MRITTGTLHATTLLREFSTLILRGPFCVLDAVGSIEKCLKMFNRRCGQDRAEERFH